MSKVIACQLKLIPYTDRVFGKPKQLFYAKFYILKAKIWPLALKVVHQSSPEEIFFKELTWVNYSWRYPFKFRVQTLGSIRLYLVIFSYWMRAKLHYSPDVAFVDFYNLLGFTQEQIVRSLELPWVVVAFSWSAHAFIVVEFPVNSDGSVIWEQFLLPLQIFHHVTSQSNSSQLILIRWLKPSICAPGNIVSVLTTL